MVCALPIGSAISLAETQQIVINTSFSYLYKEPNFDEFYQIEVKKGEILDVSNEIDSFYEVKYTLDSNVITGYIPCEFASIYTQEQETLLVYNGKIIHNTPVYTVAGNEIIENITLSPGHEIYIYDGFDSDLEFTKVKFSYNNQIYTASIPTINLSPNGVNKGVIIALSIITALVGVIFVVLGIKKKKSGTKN